MRSKKIRGREMRLDKFLKVSRIIKRRTIANEACDAGRVFIDNKVAKAGTHVFEGNVIDIQFGDKRVSYKVNKVLEIASKSQATEMTTQL